MIDNQTFNLVTKATSLMYQLNDTVNKNDSMLRVIKN